MTWNPGTPDVDNQAPVVSQDALELSSERPEPIEVVIRIDVAVILLADQSKRRTRHNEIDRTVFNLAAQIFRVALVVYTRKVKFGWERRRLKRILKLMTLRLTKPKKFSSIAMR